MVDNPKFLRGQDGMFLEIPQSVVFHELEGDCLKLFTLLHDESLEFALDNQKKYNAIRLSFDIDTITEDMVFNLKHGENEKRFYIDHYRLFKNYQRDLQKALERINNTEFGRYDDNRVFIIDKTITENKKDIKTRYKYKIIICLEKSTKESFTFESNYLPRIGENFHYLFGGDGHFERRVIDVLHMFSDREENDDRPIEVWIDLDSKFNSEFDELTSCNFDGTDITKGSDNDSINEILLRQKELAQHSSLK